MTERALAEIADEIERLFGESREAHAAFNASEGDRNCATAADESWLRLTRAMVRHVTPILAALRRPEPAADAVEAVARAIAQAEGCYGEDVLLADAKWAEHWSWYLEHRGQGGSADYSSQSKWERIARAALAVLPRPEADAGAVERAFFEGFRDGWRKAFDFADPDAEEFAEPDMDAAARCWLDSYALAAAQEGAAR